MLKEPFNFIQRLYELTTDIVVEVSECGVINSRYIPSEKKIFICYETLYYKVRDYSDADVTDAVFENRVFKNVMFTFLHEMGYAIIHQFTIDAGGQSMEDLADEFAALSMIWRNEQKWKDVVMISALHFKNRALAKADKKLYSHSEDMLRYERMICLLYGITPKYYFILKDQTNRIIWLKKPCMKYYLERSDYWVNNLRNHVKRNYFNNCLIKHL